MLNRLQSDVDNSSAHSFKIRGNNLSGPGDYDLLVALLLRLRRQPLLYARSCWEVFYNGHAQHWKLTILLLSRENEVTERDIDGVVVGGGEGGGEAVLARAACCPFQTT